MTEPKESGSPAAETRTAGSVRRYEITVGGYDHPFKFTVALSDFQEFQREAQRDAAMATNNFLLRTCTTPPREKLLGIFEEHWGLPGLLMDRLATEMVGMRAVHLKNSTGA